MSTASSLALAGVRDTARPRYGFSLRRLFYLSIIVAASASTIAIVSKVQRQKKISASAAEMKMISGDACLEVKNTIVGGKTHEHEDKASEATPDEVVPVAVAESNKIVPDFHRTLPTCNAITGCTANGDPCDAGNNNECEGNPNSSPPVSAECCTCEAIVCSGGNWYCGETCSLPTSEPSLNPSVSGAPSSEGTSSKSSKNNSAKAGKSRCGKASKSSRLLR